MNLCHTNDVTILALLLEYKNCYAAGCFIVAGDGIVQARAQGGCAPHRPQARSQGGIGRSPPFDA